MAASRKPPVVPPARSLTPDEMRSAVRKLERRIGELRQFDISTINSRWDADADALRKKINSTLADVVGDGTTEYNRYSVRDLDSLPIILGGGRHFPPQEIQASYREGLARAASQLQTLVEVLQERLEDSAETPQAVVAQARNAQVDKGSRRVFIVHGHDDQAKLDVARFLEKLKLEAVILHEQPNLGRTIIEKLEAHADVAFAVVLMTPDDEGRAAGGEFKPRPRQNVLLELGLFLGAIGRSKVCALYKGELELPSDYAGVVYERFDPAGGWQMTLARELKASGLDVDMNLVFAKS